MKCYRPLALIKGAGDLATGVALRLFRAGFRIVMTETAQPTPVRRTVAFAEAVYDGSATVEGVRAERAESKEDVFRLLEAGTIPVLVDPEARCLSWLHPHVLVDAIIAKRNLGTSINDAPAVIALGPGFTAGEDCHAVIETMRGHDLGRVIWRGQALPNTGVPGEIGGKSAERVLRAPKAGTFRAVASIGDLVHVGQVVGYVDDAPITSSLDGVLRGLLRSGLYVTPGFKMGDVDPRAKPEHCLTVSDKANAVAGGVLEAACTLLGGVCFGLDV